MLGHKRRGATVRARAIAQASTIKLRKIARAKYNIRATCEAIDTIDYVTGIGNSNVIASDLMIVSPEVRFDARDLEFLRTCIYVRWRLQCVPTVTNNTNGLGT